MMAGAAGVGQAYDCIQTSFFVIDGQGYIRYRRTNLEGGMPAFIPEEVGPVVDQAIAELQASSVGDFPHIPFTLNPPYPNPFNPVTHIPYTLEQGQGTAEVILQVLDVRGRLVKTLVSGFQDRGKDYQVIWDGTDKAGIRVSSGVYLTQLKVDGESRTRLINLVQ